MTISVVIVTWNGLHVLRACIEALQAQTISHELVVVDNGSTDGTVAWLRTAVPTAKLVALPSNLGFAGGNNAGLRAASGDLLVLLNNDTVAPPTFLAEITRPFIVQSNVGSVAGVLVFAHRLSLIASAGIEVGRDGVHRDARMLQLVTDLPDTLEEIFGASGGAVCYSRAALVDAGLFPERFFNYLEDADLAWRLRLRGWPCLLAPDARVAHVYSATSGHFSPAKRRLLALNRWRVLLRCMPGELLRTCVPAIARYELLAMAYAVATGQFEIVAGRARVLRELPQLLAERHQIAHRSGVSPSDLMRWLVAAPTPGQVRDQVHRLDQVLRTRPAPQNEQQLNSI